MKATEAKLIEFLKKSPQFVIPIYQRTYSWTEAECRQLWDDVVRSGQDDKVIAHFIGSIVYVEKGLSTVTAHEPLLVIDGQQRLTTLTLLLAALARTLDGLEDGKREPIDGFSARKLRNYYLLNPEEEGERHYKLLLSQTDKDSLIAILDSADQPQTPSVRVVANFELFSQLIGQNLSQLDAVCRGIAKLVVVDVALNRDQDNPQLIFESMNSTGKELSQADLIRNYVLMGLEPKLQTSLYQKYWRPMELDFGQAAYSTYFDAFMRHYLTVKTGDIPRLDKIYEAFKTYSRSQSVADAGVEALVKDVRKHARHFCCMAMDLESDQELKLAFHDLREFRVEVAYPFLLELYSDYADGVLSKKDFVAILRTVESYAFRRAICAIPTNSMNKTFATFSKLIRKDAYLESVLANLMILPSYRRFPRDEEFVRDIQTRDLYNFPRRSYWLRRLENHDRKERVPVDEYTIEHIMPQNENLSAEWRAELGTEWDRVHKTWLHTLGNLTLTGYNPEYSDRSFAAKQSMKGGFKETPLRVSAGLGQAAKWDEAAIKDRAQKLANMALDVWPAPVLTADQLKKYQRQPPKGSYTIQDHPYLLTEPNAQLFAEFSRQVLELNPCVTQEFLKLYVAFKAETNFVDVVPQAKRLRLSLNIDIRDLNDPKSVAEDVTNLGRWGNGDTEVVLSSMDEMPYAIGLVKQAFERQMGDNS